MRQEAITLPMNNQASFYTIQSLLAVPSAVEKHIRKQLLGECLHVGQTYLITHDSEMVTAEIATQYFAALEELIAGKPFAYVLGKQSFWQHEFLNSSASVMAIQPDPVPKSKIFIDLLRLFL